MKKAGKKVLSLLMAVMLVIFNLSPSVFALETDIGEDSAAEVRTVTSVGPFVGSPHEEIKWETVEFQEVEIRVTDGYHPISGSEVSFAGEVKTTGNDGKAIFESVKTSDSAYPVSVKSVEFGEKSSSLYVNKQIKTGTEPKMEFVVSFWQPDDPVPNDVADKTGAIAAYTIHTYNPIGTLEKWVTGPNIPAARWGHDSVVVNGKLYLGPTEGAWGQNLLIYDILTNEWSSSEESPKKFDAFIAYKNKLYCFSTNSLVIYDTRTDTWAESTLSLNLQTAEACLDEDSGRIYLYEVGRKLSGYNQHIYVYSIHDNELRTGTSILPEGLSFPAYNCSCTGCYNDKFYIIGNLSGTEYLYALDSQADTCQEIAICHNGKEPSMTIYNGKIYLFGGQTTSWPYTSNAMDIYDIDTGKWTVGNTAIKSSMKHTATLVGHYIYIVGGRGSAYNDLPESMFDIMWYDINGNYWSWESNTQMVGRKKEHSTAEYNGKLYVTGDNSSNPSSLEVFTYKNQTPEIINVTPFDDINVEIGTSIDELKTKLQTDYPNATVTLSNGRTASIPVDWSIADSDYTESAELGSCFEIIGNLVPGSSAKNTDENQATIRVSVVHYNPIVSVENPSISVKVKHGTTADELKNKLQEENPSVRVTFTEGEPKPLPVTWKVSESEYNGLVSGRYIISGDLNLSIGDYSNPNNLHPSTEVVVLPDPNSVIVSVDPVSMTTKQDTMLLSWEETEDPNFLPEDVQNEFGVLNYDVLPKYASVHFSGKDPSRLPVHWDDSEYDSAKTGTQTLKGWIDIDNTEITNPDKIEAELEITVTPQEYLVWKAAPTNTEAVLIPLETSLSDLNQILKDAQYRFSVESCYADTGQEIFTFCDLVVKEEYNTDWANKMGTPGEYTLTASLPDNFTPLSDEEPGSFTISVEVAGPSPIAGYEEIYLDEYQSVDPSKYNNLPEKVSAWLENGLNTEIDVEWDWSTFDKDVVGDQVVVGQPKNLPVMVDQSVETEEVPSLVISVTPVTYKITEVLSDNTITVKSGLSLAEITQAENPTLTYEITSTSPGIDLVTDYTIPAPLEDEKNSDYICDPANGTVTTDGYVAHATIDLPDNISVGEGLAHDEVLLILLQNEVERFRPINIVVREGTPFESINLPQAVVAELDAVLNEENETQSLPVQWDGSGYEPYPEGLTDDHSVSFKISGTVTDFYGYINPSELVPELIVTVAREYDIVSVTPARIPETDTIAVNLGASLDDIYQKLKDTTVQVTLRSTNDKLSTIDVSFELRDDDNVEYSPELLGQQPVWGHLLCDDNIKNPNNIMVEIAVEKKVYKISSAVIGRVTGVEKGTTFDQIDMPESVNVIRSDGESDSAPVAEWDGSKYNPNKIGTQIVSGTFGNLPIHLENPYNRQPKAFVTVVDSTAKIISIEPMRAFALYSINNVPEVDETPGYIEHKFLVKLLHENGEETEEIMSVYTQES